MQDRTYDSAAHRYDIIASLISMGLDTILRNSMANEVCGDTALDIGTGTGESAFAISRRSGASVIAAIDPSAKMLERADAKQTPEEAGKLFFSRAAGENLPFCENCFDCVTTAFAIKHSEAPGKFISEARRVLKPGGKLVVMEAQIPETAVARTLFTFHIKTFTPFLASFFGLSGQYRTFHKQMEKFPSDTVFMEMMESEGFEQVRCVKLLFGTAAIYTGKKPVEV